MSRRAARLAFALAGGLWLAGAAQDALWSWVARTELPPLAVETGTEVVARDGRLLRAYTVEDGRWRLALAADAVDPGYLAMLIAFEDKRFATHRGVDPLALVRASWQAARSGKVVSGGSTLTMQVARLLEASGTGRLDGKLRQIRVALALEQRLGKDEIVRLYLHLAPYGGNVEGLRAATLSWFGKEPRRLTPGEAALLVALPQSPEARRPDRAPEAARDGRKRVLARAQAAGLIDAPTAAAARSEPVPHARRPFPALAPHLADRLRSAHPATPRLRTTLDAELQRQLEALGRERLRGMPQGVQVAMILADHVSGEVLAHVGSAGLDDIDGRQGFVDMTRALRSPGSTLKPLIYALAFDDGLAHPETLIEDRPRRFGTYAPQNFDRRFRGTVRASEALALSLNLPVVSLTEALGPERLLQGLRRAGATPVVPGDAPPGLAIALGGVGMTLEDLARLYASIAQGGAARALAVQPGAASKSGERLTGPVAAWQVADLLSRTPPPAGHAGGLAYKTGTSYGHRDTWAAGFDGRHVAVVWMGRPDGTPVPGAFGADHAAPVLFSAFARTKPRLDPLPPPPAATLIVTTAELPRPLQRFEARGGRAAEGLTIASPPEGAEVALDGAPLVVRLSGGQAPFTWLADEAPVLIGAQTPQAELALSPLGPLALTVIDAAGASASVRLVLTP